LRELNEKWKSEGRPALATRIGINTGELIVGNMGSATRLNYTVVGDSVNLASRLEGLNKFYGTEAMISETTYEQARDWIVARPLEKVSVKGKEEGVLVYELLGLTDEADKETVELAELSEEAISTYYEREFSRAEKLFAEILEMRPSDVAAKLLSEECRRLADSPPPPDWDGIRRMEKK
jgi:adenylate cyclase